MRTKKIFIALMFVLFIGVWSTPVLAKSLSTGATKTDAQKSYVVLNKKTAFLNNQGKKTKKYTAKGRGYRIYSLKTLGKQIYYRTKSKLWLPAETTHGTVWYDENSSNTMIVTTNKKGQISYSLYSSAQSTKEVILKRNSYVYTNQGLLKKDKHNAITLLKKGQKLKCYSYIYVHGTRYCVTDQGWVKANNVTAVSSNQTKSKKINKKVKNS